MLNRQRKIRGATLIELMGSVLVFMIGIAALIGVYLQSVTAARRADLFYISYNLAKNHVETLKTISFSNLSSAAEVSSPINQDGVPDLGGDFLRTTTVSTSYSGDANLTQVMVGIKYKMKGAWSVAPVELTTVIANLT